MRFGKELVAIGLTSATLAGCGEQVSEYNSNIQTTPHSYDISAPACDDSEAIIEASRALEAHQELKTNVLYSTVNDASIWAISQHNGPIEVINPLAVTCNGSVKYILGIDRGFSGSDYTRVLSASVSDLRFELQRSDHATKKLSVNSLNNYLSTTEAYDKGPSPTGVSGLFSPRFKTGFGMMP